MLSAMFAMGWAVGGAAVAIYFYLAGLVRDPFEFQLHRDGGNVETLMKILIRVHEELTRYRDRFGEWKSPSGSAAQNGSESLQGSDAPGACQAPTQNRSGSPEGSGLAGARQAPPQNDPGACQAPARRERDTLSDTKRDESEEK